MDDIRIRTHKELSGVAEKYYGFTFRQWLFLVLTGIITVPTYLYLTPILGDEISSWIVIIMGLPLMLCGFLTLQGMTADRLLPFLKRHYLDFGKPLEYKTEKELLAEKEAKKNLKIFSGNTHDVITGVTIYDLYQDEIISFYEKTEVTFRKLSSSMIQNYIDQEKNIYQRCGYGLSAFSFISKIHGDITNLYGLPMKKLEKELALLGYTLDDFKDVKVLKK